ncbi:MAG: hypothetical protein WC479_11045 [Candidatus Izemoplasmatales bacterium]
MDTNDVQKTEISSVTSETSSEVTPGTGVAKEPLTEAKIAELIQREVSKATEIAKRELQSTKDKARAEVEFAQRQARVANDSLQAGLKELDPDSAAKVKLARYEAEDVERKRIAEAEAVRQMQEDFHNKFKTGLEDVVKELDVDPKDPRIDWAENAANYLEAQQRVIKSATKIHRENLKKMQDGFEARLKAIETGKPVSVEANSVDTSASTAGAVGTDADFIRRFANQELPVTKENVARYNKIINS